MIVPDGSIYSVRDFSLIGIGFKKGTADGYSETIERSRTNTNGKPEERSLHGRDEADRSGYAAPKETFPGGGSSKTGDALHL